MEDQRAKLKQIAAVGNSKLRSTIIMKDMTPSQKVALDRGDYAIGTSQNVRRHVHEHVFVSSVVYLAPEALTPELLRSLSQLAGHDKLAAIVFDEVHCVATWYDSTRRRSHSSLPLPDTRFFCARGHSFRMAYKQGHVFQDSPILQKIPLVVFPSPLVSQCTLD
jgi:hypothetical protein